MSADRILPLDEIVRLARVAAHECPPDELMLTDWMDCAMKVCRAISGIADTIAWNEDAIDADRWRCLREALDAETLPAGLHAAFQDGPQALDAAIDRLRAAESPQDT